MTAESRILSGPVARETLRFGLPLALGMGLQTALNLVDAYVISRLEPSEAGPALGAIGICDQLTAVGTIVSYGITTASAALIAQAHGRGDKGEVRRLVWQSILLIGALAVVFGLTSALFAGPILSSVVGAKGKVAELGASYLRINAGGAFSMFFLLHLTGIQRALGSAKTPVALLVGANVLNLFLAIVLVYGPGPAPPVFAFGPVVARALSLPRLGLMGAAWATVIARLLTLVPVVILLVRRFDVMKAGDARGPDRTLLRLLWRTGWPSSAQLVVRMLAMLLTHSLVARAFTTADDQSATTALGIVFRLETLAFFMAMGWGSAAQTFVGQNLGASLPERARKSGWIVAAYDAALMLGIAAVFVAYARPIVELFDTEPKVTTVAVGYLSTVVWGYVGLGTGVVLGSAITGAGATRTALIADLCVVLGVQVPASVLAVLLPGASLDRLWISIAATYAASGLVYLFVFRLAPWMDAAKRQADRAPAAPEVEERSGDL